MTSCDCLGKPRGKYVSSTSNKADRSDGIARKCCRCRKEFVASSPYIWRCLACSEATRFHHDGMTHY